MRKKLLNRCQANWLEFVSLFDYKIIYQPGRQNCIVDVLTRWLGDLPEGRDERLHNMRQVVLKPPEQFCLLADGPHVQGCNSISDLFAEAHVNGPLPGKILEIIPTNSGLKEIAEGEFNKEK